MLFLKQWLHNYLLQTEKKSGSLGKMPEENLLRMFPALFPGRMCSHSLSPLI
jgi:hypothetical protein